MGGGQAVRARAQERLAIDREEAQVRQTSHRGGAGDGVEESDFAEVIAWYELADLAPARVHGCLALEEHVEAVRCLALADDVLAGSHRALLAERGERFDAALVHARQERNDLQQLGRLARRLVGFARGQRCRTVPVAFAAARKAARSSAWRRSGVRARTVAARG